MPLAFVNYPQEGAIIGAILAGYGELDYQCSHCLSSALQDREGAFRAFFRLRGEEQRIEIADALMRAHYEQAELKDKYDTAINGLRWCKKIRNQYSHYHWAGFDKTAGLFFTNMEIPAKLQRGEIIFHMRHVDVGLLRKQEEYFDYTQGLKVYWLFSPTR
jgi:hypothetical protein